MLHPFLRSELKPTRMTIQENNRMMQAQLKQQAEKSRQTFQRLIVSNKEHDKRLAMEHYTRAEHFEKIAQTMFVKNWAV